jgi:hypothetical protein
LHSAERFLNRKDVKQLILVISPEDREDFMSKFGANVMILGVEVVDGGTLTSINPRCRPTVGNGGLMAHCHHVRC